MHPYKISVILAVYNLEKYIGEAFESLKRQTIGFHNLEVIFVDDASTDRSGKIVDEYAEQYENVLTIHLELNSGYCGKPRNVGLETCTAEYIMFLDPDDVFEDNACEVLYTTARKMGCDVVSGYFSIMDSSGKNINTMGNPYPDFDEFHIKRIDDYPEALRMRVAFWAKLYTRKLLMGQNIRFDETIPGQDAIASVECMLAANGIVYIKKPIVRYRLRDDKDKSITFQISLKNMTGIDKAFRSIYEILERAQRTQYFNIMIRDFAAYYINALIDSDLVEEDLPAYLDALRFTLAQCVEYSMFNGSETIKRIATEVAASRMDNAANMVFAIRPYRRDVLYLQKDRLGLQRKKDAELAQKDTEWIILKADRDKLDTMYTNLQKNVQSSVLCRLVRKVKKWTV